MPDSKLEYVVIVFTALVLFAVNVPLVWAKPIAGAVVVNQESGIYQTAAVPDLALHDRARNKDLHVRVTYPKAPGPFPVVILSHGAGGSTRAYLYLAQHWAAHGYICIQPNHADSTPQTLNMKERLTHMKSVLSAITTDTAGWYNRCRDISFVLDSLPVLSEHIPARINSAMVGVAGHSYGAYTAMLIAGARVPGDAFASPIDSRVKAVIAMSPQGVKRVPADFGFDDSSSFRNLRIPAMFITGTNDTLVKTSVADRKAAFAGCPDGNKYFMMVNGANHMTFAGRLPAASGVKVNKSLRDYVRARLMERLSITPEDGDKDLMLGAIENATTKFLNAYLKNDQNSERELETSSVVPVAVARIETH